MQFKSALIAAALATASSAATTNFDASATNVGGTGVSGTATGTFTGTSSGDANNFSATGAVTNGNVKANVPGLGDVEVTGFANGHFEKTGNSIAAQGAFQAVVKADGCNIIIQANGIADAKVDPTKVDLQGAVAASGYCLGFDGGQVAGTFKYVDGQMVFVGSANYCYTQDGKQVCNAITSNGKSVVSTSSTPAAGPTAASTSSATSMVAGFIGTVAAVFAAMI